MHKRISAKQRTKKMNTKNLKNVSWRSNVKENIKILIEENVPRDKIAELAWKTRKFAIENKFQEKYMEGKKFVIPKIFKQMDKLKYTDAKNDRYTLQEEIKKADSFTMSVFLQF